MSKHTPGPWKYWSDNGYGDTRFYIAQEDGAPYTSGYSDVATLIAETVSGEKKAVQEANARLIAAAPEMLEALEGIADHYDMDGYGEKAWKQLALEMAEIARAAISKATAP